MSHSRPLDKMKPTKALLIDSMSCEEKAAHVRNEAVDAIQNQNDMEVGYRYLQSRSGRISTSYEAKLAGVFAILGFVNLCKNPGFIPAFAMLTYIANIFPNLSNWSRYQETENACAEWLKNKFNEQEFKQIQNMSYNEKDLNSLTLFFKSKNIPAEKKKNKDIEIIQDSLMSLTLAFFVPEVTLAIFVFEIAKLLERKLFPPSSHQAHDSNPRPARL